MTHASRTAATFSPPVMEARRWLDGVTFPPDRPLINVSQAAPVDPPPEALRKVIAEAALRDPQAHLYGPVLGRPDLREKVADQWTRAYGGQVEAHQVAITSGCNQAFSAAMTALCSDGDEVLLPVPWYFNHKMWLDMSGIDAVPLPTVRPDRIDRHGNEAASVRQSVQAKRNLDACARAESCVGVTDAQRDGEACRARSTGADVFQNAVKHSVRTVEQSDLMLGAKFQSRNDRVRYIRRHFETAAVTLDFQHRAARRDGLRRLYQACRDRAVIGRAQRRIV